MGGGSDKEERSISRPYYGATTGVQAGVEPNQAHINFQNQRNQQLAEEQNNKYRNENPILAVADDTVHLVKQLVFVGVGVSISYVAIQAYSVYKQR